MRILRRESLLAASLSLALALPARAADPVRTTGTAGQNHHMDAVVFTPDGPGPFPALMLLPTARGMNLSDEAYARKLAQVGYVVLIVDFTRSYGLIETRDPVFKGRAPIYTDLIHVEDQIAALPKVRQGGVGTIGFSAGGFFALGLASRHRTTAAVSYYPALGQTAHTDREVRLEQSFTASSAPVLMLHGTVDHIPATAVENLDRALTAAGAPHETKIYHYAGHEFDRLFDNPGNEAAAADAWQRTLAFFQANLH